MRTAFKLSLALAALAILSSPALAGFTLTITESDPDGNSASVTHTYGTATTNFADQVVTGGLQMSFSGAIGDVSLLFSGTLSSISPTVDKLDLHVTSLSESGTNVGSGSPVILTITASQDGLTWPSLGPAQSGALILNSSGGIGGDGKIVNTLTMTGAGTGSLQAGIDNSGNSSAGSYSTAPSLTKPVSVAGGPPVTGTFTLTNSMVFTFNASGLSASADSFGTAITPEPGTLAILASGLPLLGIGAARRRRKKAMVA